MNEQLQVSNQKHSEHCGDYYVPQDCQNGICIDIGGNMGCFSLKYKDFFSKIHIYEPQTEAYRIIKNKIIELQNICLYNEAVYHTSNQLVSLVSHHNLDSGSVAVKSDIIQVPEWTSNIVDNNCLTVSIEDIILRIGGGYVEYMKIDCETSEYYLLMDKDLSKIKYMGIELHWQLGKENFDKLVNHILKYFDNPFNSDLNYPIGHNIEVFFKSKML